MSPDLGGPVLEESVRSGRAGRAGKVELHSPEQAEVVNFAVGDTQLVMIFDAALEL